MIFSIKYCHEKYLNTYFQLEMQTINKNFWFAFVKFSVWCIKKPFKCFLVMSRPDRISSKNKIMLSLNIYFFMYVSSHEKESINFEWMQHTVMELCKWIFHWFSISLSRFSYENSKFHWWIISIRACIFQVSPASLWNIL